MPRFLHTADWQIGKPFQYVEDAAKREKLRQQRVDTVRGLKTLIDEEQLEFVVVCGDLFDSATPDHATVSALCSAVGSLDAPVYAIPGNHDHAGPGCIWEQRFFQRERDELAPNLHVLLEPDPLPIERAVLLPCPMRRRHESVDPTAWLRAEPEGLPEDLPRIVLAHGSTQGFSSASDADATAAVNQIELDRLPSAAYDYIALGDWHGYKEIAPGAGYSGAPEQDRFAKGENNRPGHVLAVEIAGRRSSPSIRAHRVGRIAWHAPEPFHLTGDGDLDPLEARLDEQLAKRTNEDLMKLDLSGTLGFGGARRLDALLESLRARLIDLRVDKNLSIEPADEELAALVERNDPLIAQVARELRDATETDPLARDALRELHIQIMKYEG